MWERPPGLDNQGQETFPTTLDTTGLIFFLRDRKLYFTSQRTQRDKDKGSRLIGLKLKY